MGGAKVLDIEMVLNTNLVTVQVGWYLSRYYCECNYRLSQWCLIELQAKGVGK